MAAEHPHAVSIHGRGFNLIILSIIFTTLSLALVLLRMYFRRTVVGRFGRDDLAILFSMMFSFALGSVSCVAVAHGYGKPGSSVPLDDLHQSLLMFYLVQIFYKFTIACTKISILLLYLRIFPGKLFRHLDYGLLFFVSAYAIASIVATVVQCNPLPAAWNHSASSKCINVKISWYFNGGADMLGDFLILLLPMRAIKNLHLPTRQKLGLIGIFALGGFVCITSALRMAALKMGAKSVDPNRGTLNSTIWTIVEANTGIICACLPMLKNPVSKLFPTFFPHDRASADTPSARLRHHIHTSEHPGWQHFDTARQEYARPEPRVNARNLKQSSSNEEISLNTILKTTNIDVEYTDPIFQGTSLPQHNASNGPLTIPRAVHRSNNFATRY